MGGGVRGLDAAALVDGHIDDHRAPAHLAHHVLADQLGRRRARHQHRAHHQVGTDNVFLDGVDGGEDGVELGPELHVEIEEPLERLVQHRHRGFEPHGHARGVGPHHAAADDDDAAYGDAGHAAQQHAAPAPLHFQAVGAGLDRHASRHLAHGRQQRQPAVVVAHRLVGHGDAARRYQRPGLLRIGRQVQIGEQHLAVPQHGGLGGLRLLHLDDHVGAGEDLLRSLDDFGAGAFIIGVAEADGMAGAGLHQHAMAVMDRLAHARRRHADPVLLALDLLGHADEHGRLR